MAAGRGAPGSVGPGPGKGARPGSGDGSSGSEGFLGGNSGCGGCGTGSSGPGQFGSAACKHGINPSLSNESKHRLPCDCEQSVHRGTCAFYCRMLAPSKLGMKFRVLRSLLDTT